MGNSMGDKYNNYNNVATAVEQCYNIVPIKVANVLMVICKHLTAQPHDKATKLGSSG